MSENHDIVTYSGTENDGQTWLLDSPMPCTDTRAADLPTLPDARQSLFNSPYILVSVRCEDLSSQHPLRILTACSRMEHLHDPTVTVSTPFGCWYLFNIRCAIAATQ